MKKEKILLGILISLLILVNLLFFLPKNDPCPEDLRNYLGYPEKIKCGSRILDVEGEKIKIWEIYDLRKSNFIMINYPRQILERSEENKTFYIDLTINNKIPVNISFGVDYAIYDISLDGISGVCRGVQKPYLKIENTNTSEQKIYFKKIEDEIFIFSELEYQIYRSGCFVEGSASKSLTGNDSVKSNLTAYLIKPLDINSCDLLDVEYRDKCYCSFAVWQEGGRHMDYLKNANEYLNKISDINLRNECEIPVLKRNEGQSSHNFDPKFEKMRDEILPLLHSAYISYALNEKLEFIPTPITSKNENA